jgi:glycosyltransferase involved in cell wall biosynthesis
MKSNHPLKCLYIYDCRFIKHQNHVYAKGKITDSVLKRYIESEDNIVTITRMEYSSDIDKATLFTLPNLKFKPIKGLLFSKAFTVHLIDNLKIFSKEIKDADFIVTRLPSFLGIFGLLVNFFYKKKFFIEVAGDAQDALLSLKESPSLPFRVFTQLFFRLNQFFIKHADGVIYVTEYALQEKYPTKGYKSYASNIEIDIPKKNFNVECYELKEPTVKIGMIGDYNNHYKGITQAIQSINSLKIEGYDATLTIVGSGSQLSSYKQLAGELGVSDRVHFKGRLKGNTEILNWLETLDLYIQPSYTEGLPRALIEAMSVGLPAVATNVGGISELLDADDLVASYDSAALANRMKDFLDSTELRYKKGKLNYIKSKLYDRSKLAERRLNFWKSCRDLVKSQS